MSNAPSLTEDDIRQHVAETCKALDDLAELVISVGMNGATSARLGAIGGRTADNARNRADSMFHEARSVFVDALTGSVSEGRFVSTETFAKVLRERIADNDVAAGLRPASPLRAAMQAADAAERAERRAIASAHSLGDSICAAIGLDLPLTLRGSL